MRTPEAAPRGCGLDSIRLFGARARRTFVASLLLLLALSFIALPAGASPPPPTATTTFTDNGTCSVTVTYTWSGFKGQNLTALYAVEYVGGSYVVGILFWDSGVTGTGTSTHTFSLTGYGTHTYYGRGRLLNSKGVLAKGSDAASSTSATLTC
jgi:hypothetical protein